MSFHLSVNTVNCASQNRGILAVTIQKTGANMQSPKRRGKRAVRGQNEGSYVIDPFFVLVLYNRGKRLLRFKIK